jgi:hypothetical protein
MSFQNRKNKEHDPCFRYLSLFYLNIFFKNQNDIVLVKKKTKFSGLQSGFWPGLVRSTSWVTPGFDFPYFFLNLARFQSRVDPPGRVSKLWTKCYLKLVGISKAKQRMKHELVLYFLQTKSWSIKYASVQIFDEFIKNVR